MFCRQPRWIYHGKALKALGECNHLRITAPKKYLERSFESKEDSDAQSNHSTPITWRLNLNWSMKRSAGHNVGMLQYKERYTTYYPRKIRQPAKIKWYLRASHLYLVSRVQWIILWKKSHSVVGPIMVISCFGDPGWEWWDKEKWFWSDLGNSIYNVAGYSVSCAVYML